MASKKFNPREQLEAFNSAKKVHYYLSVVAIGSTFIGWYTRPWIQSHQQLGIASQGVFFLLAHIGLIVYLARSSRPNLRVFSASIVTGCALLVGLFAFPSYIHQEIGTEVRAGYWVAVFVTVIQIITFAKVRLQLKSKSIPLVPGIDEKPIVAPTVVVQSAPSNTSSSLDELARLADLRDRGVISDDEFESLKKKIIKD